MNSVGGKWITIKGRHVFIKDGETLNSAIERAGGKLRIKPQDNWREEAYKNNQEGWRKRNQIEAETGGVGNYKFREREDEYYNTYRDAERKNAMLKKELPNEDYEYISAYAGYRDKFEKYFGTNENPIDQFVSASLFTNDEFIDALEDANWHTERRMLLDAKLTNRQMQYVRENTKLGAYSSDLNREKTQRLIDEAKTKFPKKETVDIKEI